MKVVRQSDIASRNGDFEILTGTGKSQIASMVLKPGESSGEYGNEHAGSDQILLVLAGNADLTVNGEELRLTTGDVILIEAGEQHQVRCSGDTTLRTLNVYAPPGY